MLGESFPALTKSAGYQGLLGVIILCRIHFRWRGLQVAVAMFAADGYDFDRLAAVRAGLRITAAPCHLGRFAVPAGTAVDRTGLGPIPALGVLRRMAFSTNLDYFPCLYRVLTAWTESSDY